MALSGGESRTSGAAGAYAEPMPARMSPAPSEQVDSHASAMPQWHTVVWDDAVNLMDYVTEVLCRHFGYPRPTAHALMLEVHHLGRAVVSRGTRERMEADVLAMHSYGLHATLERAS